MHCSSSQKLINIKIKPLLACALAATVCFLLPPNAAAYWVWSPETGKFTNPQGAVEDTAEEQFQYALTAYNDNDLDTAITALEDLLKQYPGAGIAPDAELQLAVFLEEEQSLKKAFEHYQAIAKHYPQYEHLDEVIQREYDLGHVFLGGARQKVLGLPILPALPLAVKAFQHITEVAPYSEVGDDAQFYLGVALKESGRYVEAIEAFKTLDELYSQSPYASQSEFEAANTQFLMSSTASRDQQGLGEATRDFEAFLETYPDAPEYDKVLELKRQAEEQHAKKNFDIARYYEERSFTDSARIYYENVVATYPETHWGKEAENRLARLRDPAAFWREESARLAKEFEDIQYALETVTGQLSSGQPLAAEHKETLKAEEKRLDEAFKANRKAQDELEKNKRADIEQRRAVLDRKKLELKQKHQMLKKKRKALAGIESEELSRAFKRWYEALDIESDSLDRAYEKLDLLADRMDIRRRTWRDVLFLKGGPADITKELAQWESELDELRAQRKILSDRHRALEQEREAIMIQIETLEHRQVELLSSKETFKEEWSERAEALEAKQVELDLLEADLEELRARSDATSEKLKAGKDRSITSIVKAGVSAVASTPVTLLSTFVPRSDAHARGELAKLDAREARLSERMAEQEEILQLIEDTLSRRRAMKAKAEAVPTEAEKNAIEEVLSTDRGSARRHLRREIKQIERDIRQSYEQMDDHRKIKVRLIDELNENLDEAEREASGNHPFVGGAARNVKGAGRILYAFVFGLKGEEEFAEKDLKRVTPGVSPETQDRLRALQEQIAFENVMIATKRQELSDLKEELVRVKARADEAGGIKLQSLLVEQPYEWLKYTMLLPTHVIPDRDADRLLERRLEKERETYRDLKERIGAIRDRREALTRLMAEDAVEDKQADVETETSLAEIPPSGQTGLVAAGETAEMQEVITEEVIRPEDTPEQELPKPGEALQDENVRVLENELRALQDEIDERAEELTIRKSTYRKSIKAFYEKSVSERLDDQFRTEAHVLIENSNALEDRLARVTETLHATISDVEDIIREEEKTIYRHLDEISKRTASRSSLSEDRRVLLSGQADAFRQELEELKSVKGQISSEANTVMAFGREAA